jgi:hypothetical protein
LSVCEDGSLPVCTDFRSSSALRTFRSKFFGRR